MDCDASSASSSLLEAGLPRGKARSAGILLHGRDRTREEKVVLASSFQLDGIRWLAPAADTGSWYPGRFFDPVAVNEPFLSQAIDRIDRVVDEAGEGGRLGPSQIFLVGFSQGGVSLWNVPCGVPGARARWWSSLAASSARRGKSARFRQTCWPACACS